MHKLLLMKDHQEKRIELSSKNFGSWLDLKDQLVAAREARGLTQADLAEILGITQSAVSQFERLGGNPRIMTLMAYAQALQIRLNFGASPVD
jgi:transcriptional regulator with XRE-family HTH domain